MAGAALPHKKVPLAPKAKAKQRWNPSRQFRQRMHLQQRTQGCMNRLSKRLVIHSWPNWFPLLNVLRCPSELRAQTAEHDLLQTTKTLNFSTGEKSTEDMSPPGVHHCLLVIAHRITILCSYFTLPWLQATLSQLTKPLFGLEATGAVLHPCASLRCLLKESTGYQLHSTTLPG